MKKNYFILFLSVVTIFLSVAVFMLYTSVTELEQTVKNQVTSVKQIEITRVKPDSSQVVSNSTHPSFKEVAKKSTGSVVYIETEVDIKQSLPKDGNHNFDDSFWNRFNGRPRSISLGSGVLISTDGYILTNAHVIANAIGGKVTVVLNDNRSFDGNVIGVDSSTDLAVVKVNSTEFNAIPIGDSDFVEIGDWVLAIGNPFRLRSTVTAGIVSALSRDVAIIEDRMRIENFIQTDAAINRGNSGGALVNQYGELIGINTAIATETGSYEGYGFAIPANMAVKIARDLIEFGTVKRAYLGVQIASVTAKRAAELGLPKVSGVEIINALENGSAFNAGIKQGDVVLAINNKEVSAYNELQAKVAEFRPGDEISVKIWSNGKSVTKSVVLQGTEQENVKNWLGVLEPPVMEDKMQSDSLINGSPTYSPNQDEYIVLDKVPFSEQLHFSIIRNPLGDRLIVEFIATSSIFSKSGLRVGDELQTINQKPIRSIMDIKIHLQHYRSKKIPVILGFKRGEKTGFITLYE